MNYHIMFSMWGGMFMPVIFVGNDKVINICLDLGNDSLKVSYGLMVNGKLKYGKIVEDSLYPLSTINSETYFKNDTNEWVFGYQLAQIDGENLHRVVKIKYLLSLLNPNKIPESKEKKDIVKSNFDLYHNGNDFPSFVFPVRKDLFKNKFDLKARIDGGYSYSVPGYTPKKVCELFFAFVRKVIENAIPKVLKLYKLNPSEYRYTISYVYPNDVSDELLAEYKRLFELTFGVERMKDGKCMNTTRALSVYAKHLGKIKAGEGCLFFDIGDETISVTKVSIDSKGAIICDPAVEHKAPLEIGGNDIDSLLVDYVNSKIVKKETMGTPSYGEKNHLDERGLIVKQYLVVKSIKNAKLIISSPILHERCGGIVSITITREVHISASIKDEDINRLIEENKIFEKIYKYIEEELSLTANYDVNRIFLGGGVAETIHFKEFIDEHIKEYNKNKKDSKSNVNDNNIIVDTFDINTKDETGSIYDVRDFEDIVYSPCFGVNTATLQHITVVPGLAYSYGTYVEVESKVEGHPSLRAQVFTPFISKGEPLDETQEYTTFVSDVCFKVFVSSYDYFYRLRISNDHIKTEKIKELVYIDDGSENGDGVSLVLKYVPRTKNGYDPELELINKKMNSNLIKYCNYARICSKDISKAHGYVFNYYVNGKHYVLQGAKKNPRTGYEENFALGINVCQGIRVNQDGEGELFIENWFKRHANDPDSAHLNEKVSKVAAINQKTNLKEYIDIETKNIVPTLTNFDPTIKVEKVR